MKFKTEIYKGDLFYPIPCIQFMRLCGELDNIFIAFLIFGIRINFKSHNYEKVH